MAEIKEKKGLMAAQNNEDTQGDPVQRLRSQIFNQDPDKDTGPLNLSRGMNAVAKALIKYGVTKIGSPGEQIGAMEFEQKNYEDQLELAEKFLEKKINEETDARKQIKARAATINEQNRKLRETGIEVLKDPDVARLLKKTGTDLSNPDLAQVLGKRYENMRSKLSFTHEQAVATLANQAFLANKNGEVPFKDDIEAISKLRVDPTDETERMLAQEQSKKPEGFLDRFADASPEEKAKRVAAKLRADRPPLQTPRTLEVGKNQSEVFGAVSGPDRKRLRDGASNVIAAANNTRINRDITGKESITGTAGTVNTVKKLQGVVELIIDAGYKAGDDSKLGQDAMLIGNLAMSRIPEKARNKQALFNTEIGKISTGLRGLDRFEQREFIKDLRKDPNLKAFMKKETVVPNPAKEFKDTFKTTISELDKQGNVRVIEKGIKGVPSKAIVNIDGVGYRVSTLRGEVVEFDPEPIEIDPLDFRGGRTGGTLKSATTRRESNKSGKKKKGSHLDKLRGTTPKKVERPLTELEKFNRDF